MTFDAKTLAGMIDHTLLKPEAMPEQIEVLCAEAIQYGFASVCVNGVYVPLATEKLAGSAVKVCTVVGFPLGAMHPFAKVHEAKLALEQGATEIDMVLSVGNLKAENISEVHHDISSIVAECQLRGAICKVILETCLLTDQEKVVACRVCVDAGADFVKTSTGFSTGGATVEDIRLMRQTVGTDMGVKASGGIRNLATALAMIEAGATRLGVSAGVTIINELTGGTALGGDGY